MGSKPLDLAALAWEKAKDLDAELARTRERVKSLETKNEERVHFWKMMAAFLGVAGALIGGAVGALLALWLG